MKHILSPDQLLAFRLRAQCLHPDAAASDPAQAVREVCGIQAQDVSAAALQIRARTAGVTAAAVDRARAEDRSVIRTWAMRGTLHLVAAPDLAWMLPLFGPEFIRRGERRFAELGLTPEIRDAALNAIRSILGDQGPLPRPALAEALRQRGLPTEGQVIAGLVYFAGLAGALCYGLSADGQEVCVLLDAWIDPPAPLPRDDALAECARRYLHAYGPASPADMAAWSGLPLRDCRAVWDRLSGDLLEVEFGGSPLWIPCSRAAWLDLPPVDQPLVRLLGAFDAYLLGYQDRDLIVEKQVAKRINAGGGMIRPALLVDGRAAGTWKMRRSKKGAALTVDPFADLDTSILSALDAESRDIGRFLNLPITLLLTR